MNPDREMQAEAMDMAQDEILRLQEALAVEKGAHVETAKALVACRNSLSECAHAWADYLHNKDNIGWAIEELVRDAEAALSHTAGDDYVSKASVRPIVEVLNKINNRGFMSIDEAAYAVERAIEQAKLLGL